MKYKHFILTRFNVPFIDKENVEFLFTEVYLEQRFSIFKEYCFSSIRQQTNSDFYWFVFFDERTPEKYKKMNIELQKLCQNYYPVYLDMDLLAMKYNDTVFEKIALMNQTRFDNIEDFSYGDYTVHVTMASYISKLIYSFCDTDTTHVVTTRIDNDDCFHSSFMENVMKELKTNVNDDYLLSFDNGAQHIIDTCILRTFFYPNNHFTSYIEKCSECLKTVFYWDHFVVEKYKKVVHINNEIPMWIEMCHSSNVVNTLSTESRNHFVFGKIDLSGYGIDKQWTSFNTLLYIIFFPHLYLFPKLKRTIKALLR